MTPERRCPNCHQALPPEPPAPKATRLRIHHYGRSLFVVEGKTGLWCTKKEYGEQDTESVVAIDDSGFRGKPRRKCLYRQNALTEELAAVFASPLQQREGPTCPPQ